MLQSFPESESPAPHIFNPLENYSGHNYPSPEAQAAFFRHALQEALEKEAQSETAAPRLVNGPFARDFLELFKQMATEVRQINQDFTPEHLMPAAYQSREVQQSIRALSLANVRRLFDLAREKEQRIALLAAAKLHPDLTKQTIAQRVLDNPPYCHKYEDWRHPEAERTCTNACFRMVFGAITGWVPSQAATCDQLVHFYGTPVVEDNVYSRLYETEAFKKICDKKIIHADFIGADFSTIGGVVSRIKGRNPHTRVYATVSLASETAGQNVWHSCILLEVGDGTIVCHDPAPYYDGKYRVIPKDRFIDRWAMAYNRARLTIVQ